MKVLLISSERKCHLERFSTKHHHCVLNHYTIITTPSMQCQSVNSKCCSVLPPLVGVDSVGLTLVYSPQALCHIKEIPSTGSHDDPLSYYQIGDLIRGQSPPPAACKQSHPQYHALLCNRLLNRVISLYVCPPKSYICTQYLPHCVRNIGYYTGSRSVRLDKT